MGSGRSQPLPSRSETKLAPLAASLSLAATVSAQATLYSTDFSEVGGWSLDAPQPQDALFWAADATPTWNAASFRSCLLYTSPSPRDRG